MAGLKMLVIGGTGTISASCVAYALSRGVDVTVMNRGRTDASAGSDDAAGEVGEGKLSQIVCDVNDEALADKLLGDSKFDVVANFVAFSPDHVERDSRLFAGRTRQYIFISSATVYRKPLMRTPVTEDAPLGNKYWRYAHDKVECELRLGKEYRENGFPITIVRPSHTYCERSVPVCLHGKAGSWPVLRRILDGKPIVVNGDGTTWWTFMHATDFAVAFYGLLGNPRAIGEAVHITGDEYYNWDEATRIVGRALGREPKIVHVTTDDLVKADPTLEGPLLGDKSNPLVFDNSKIKSLSPGFVCRVRYDQGVRAAIDYILARPQLQVNDPEFDAFCDALVAARA